MDVLPSIRRVFEKEVEIQKEFDNAFEAHKKYFLTIYKSLQFADELNQTVIKMGSVADGCISARWLTEKFFTFEADFLFAIFDEIPKESLFQVDGKPGFYRIKAVDLRKTLVGAARIFIPDLNLDMLNMLSDNISVIKDIIMILFSYDGGKRDIGQILSKATGQPEESFKNSSLNTEINGPAVTVNWKILCGEEHIFDISHDFAFAVKLSFWPEDAESWITRERIWPPKALINDLVKDKNVYLVAKPAEESGKEFRLTFPAEKRIIEEWTSVMKFTYYLFKILFYEYFKMEVDGKILGSYLAKSTMFWLCEKMDPSLWTESNICANVQKLIEKLFGYIDSGYLPQYFVPEINLLGNVSENLLTAARNIKDRSRLLMEPLKCLPQTGNNVIEYTDNAIKILQEWDKHYSRQAEIDNGAHVYLTNEDILNVFQDSELD